MKQIKRYFLSVALLLASLFLSVDLMAGERQKRVLMVVSGYGQQQGEEKPGYEFDEFSKAYLVFKAHNIVVDIASPKGGAVEADKYDPGRAYNQQVLNDSYIMEKLGDTLSLANLAADNYDGIFIVGGKGAMFDLPNDLALQKAIADIYQNQGTVAAVCHGPVALVNVKLKDGSYLVADKAVNGFTNQEEQLFGKKWMSQFEFMLEDKLVERGGVFQSGPIMLDHVATDERLITGQNPSSTVSVATQMVSSMGIRPVEMEQHRDDRTLALVAQLLDGSEQAEEELSGNSAQYHIELVGMYGYYFLNIAESDKELHDALRLMLLGQKAINNPRLDIQIAKTQNDLGDKSAAVTTLNRILSNNPDFEPAQDMLKTLSL